MPPGTEHGGQKIASFIAGINASLQDTKDKDLAALQFVKFMTSPETQEPWAKPFSSLPVLKGETRCSPTTPKRPNLRGHLRQAVIQAAPRWCPVRTSSSTVGKAMNTMFAKIATGGTVTADDVKNALKDAQDGVAAAS